MNASTVVIVGRINAGKSSLFNRLTGGRQALVSTVMGTTRDYNIGTVEWQGGKLQLIDTGGVDIAILKNSIQSLGTAKQKKRPVADNIEQAIVTQTKEALSRADLILFVVDSQTGPLPQDKELARVLTKLAKPIIVVANKSDNPKHRANATEFFGLGAGPVMPVSAANGSGIGDLLDMVFDQLKTSPKNKSQKVFFDPGVRVAFVGKTNAGKSSLVNKILGQNRVIVSHEPHTTREPQNTTIEYNGQAITIIDTAGLRKKGRIRDFLDKAVLNKTIGIIKQADVVVLVTEASDLISRQDQYLAGMAKDLGKGIVMVANKWDLVEDKSTASDTKFRQYYQRSFPYLSFAPLLFVSAITGKNILSILDTVFEVNRQLNLVVPQEKLDAVLASVVARHKPAKAKGNRKPSITGIEQTGTRPPRFTVHIGAQQSLHFSYMRFIENQLRDEFDFTGAPIKIHVSTD